MFVMLSSPLSRIAANASLHIIFNTHTTHVLFSPLRLLHSNRFYMETYGCQMNFSDSEVVHSILTAEGYERVHEISQASTALLLTCAVREGAEDKIWRRMKYLRVVPRAKNMQPLRIGILGCMAERLKEKLLEGRQMQDTTVFADFIGGPDAYRDLPKLISDTVDRGIQGASLALSLEETYADIKPIRKFGPVAFLAVMRGCDNMCSYCIVPFVRGRERSRPISSIVDEVQRLSDEGDVKEIVLLGQNVNSYRDMAVDANCHASVDTLAPGFKTVYRQKVGGLRFADLLDATSRVNPNLRIRFTSPHPKDFNSEVLRMIAERSNICSQLHIPAQSGSSAVLERMNRGYTQEAYLELVDRAKATIPGFCGETEDEHRETLSLVEQVGYAYGFCFPFSLRAKTRAFHRLADDVPQPTKSRRHMELKEVIRASALRYNQSLVGTTQLALVESVSKRSASQLAGRVDSGVKAIFDRHLPDATEIRIGDYVAVRIESCTSQTLCAAPIRRTNIVDFYAKDDTETVESCE